MQACMQSLKAGCHCFQLVWVVQLVVQLASEIPDFKGMLDCPCFTIRELPVFVIVSGLYKLSVK